MTISEANLKSNIASFEKDLKNKNTSVNNELKSQISRLKIEKKSAATANEKEQIQELIDTTNELLNDYNNYNQSTTDAASIYSTTGSVYDPAIAAIVSWFASKKYYLSAELLTQAKNNKTLDSTYKPTYGSRANSSSVIKEIKKSSSVSNAFPNSGTTVDADLYYAIHNFRYIKTSSNLIVKDRYDFAPGDYDGLAGTAVNTMYLAQMAGAIVPFQVVITLPKI